MRVVEVRTKDGKTFYFSAQYSDSSLPADMNGAPEAALELLQQLPADLLAHPPRIIFTR